MLCVNVPTPTVYRGCLSIVEVDCLRLAAEAIKGITQLVPWKIA